MLAEDLRLEDEDEGAPLPGVCRESGLQTGVLEKRVAIPSVFFRHLRQQQTAAVSQLDDQSVSADFDLLNRFDLALGREDRDLHLDADELVRHHWTEPWIRIRDGLRQFGD